MLRLCHLVLPLLTALTVQAQTPFRPKLEPASDAPFDAMKTFRPAHGLEVELIAAEPDVANPVALDVDAQGRIWVCETFRLRAGVFDMRDFRQWIDDDLAARTVADRVAMMKKHWAKQLDEFRVAHERVRLLRDTNGDGKLESTVFADGFNDLAHGIAAGVMAWGDDVWFTCLPELWRLRDKDGDGKADEREAVHKGFGVRFQFIGHDLHGLRVGPDRRLYFSIGDRGLHVETEGRTISYPDSGAVLRCELDGSNLELFATGLRNPQELAFDAHGNLFTGDNNSDSGDRARWVYLVEGSDCGWRCGYQWLPDRGPWNREKLWHPAHTGQPAWIVPPIANIIDGPSGLTYYPGTGLPDRYDNHFFLCDFRANPTVSGIHALRLAPRGANFELVAQERFLWGVCATDVEFGYDGGLYLSDWVSGWSLPMRGRVYRVQDKAVSASASVTDTQAIMRAGMGSRGVDELQNLLGHRDMRVRLAAEFELVDRNALDAMSKVAHDPNDRLARLHAIWGIGVLARRQPDACKKIEALLACTDSEIAAQVARVCGDAGYEAAAAKIAILLRHSSSRARQFAAHALAHIGSADQIPQLCAVLRDNADRDAHLRHAAVFALAKIGDVDALRAASADADASVRRGILLALSRLGSADCARFLADPDPEIAREASRSIYRESITDAMPALASLIHTPELADLSIGRRAINAHRRLGKTANAVELAAFAQRATADRTLRIEALEILAEWSKPKPRDRVVGGWRKLAQREDPKAGDTRLAQIVPGILAARDEPIARAAARIAGSRKLRGASGVLTRVAADRKREGDTRAAAFLALDALGDKKLTEKLTAVNAEDPVSVRLVAVRLLAKRQPETTVPLLASLCANATKGERQNAMTTLGKVKAKAADAVVCEWLDRLAAGNVPADMQLEVLEAAERRKANPEIAQRLTKRDASLPPSDLVAPYTFALRGGNKGKGRKVFHEHAAAQCLRCHMVSYRGGSAGPRLDKIGKKKSRQHLLEALVHPNAHIAEGFAMQIVTLHDGTVHAGVLAKETDTQIEIADAAGTTTKIAKRDIKSRDAQNVSSMPPMGGLLSKRELRDVVEYLANLK